MIYTSKLFMYTVLLKSRGQELKSKLVMKLFCPNPQSEYIIVSKMVNL